MEMNTQFLFEKALLDISRAMQRLADLRDDVRMLLGTVERRNLAEGVETGVRRTLQAIRNDMRLVTDTNLKPLRRLTDEAKRAAANEPFTTDKEG